jgi:hypothetical protein
VIRDGFVAQGIGAHVTTCAPLFPTGFEVLNLTCPHGLRVYAEPTSEQRAAWRDFALLSSDPQITAAVALLRAKGVVSREQYVQLQQYAQFTGPDAKPDI